MARTFSGTTEDSQLPILGGKFWKQGVQIQGQFLQYFTPPNSRIGRLCQISLRNPLKLKNDIPEESSRTPWDNAQTNNWVQADDGDEYREIQIGSLSGFDMAVRACHLPNNELLRGDLVSVECIGFKKTQHESDQILFKVSVSRP